jgi:peptide/nickel transport system ATP-binding protein
MLVVENLRVAYPATSATQGLDYAVDGVSFVLQPGEKLGFVGESGCGKTTIGKTLMRLLPVGTQVEGNLSFEGKSIAALEGEELRRYRGEVVGLIFQDPMTRLNPLMTIGEHCMETLQAHASEFDREKSKQKALATLAAVKISGDRWGDYPHQFSGGMRQRVAIALALLANPKAIVADEPTTSLDVRVSAEILQELTRLCQERDLGLILISHDLATVAEYCDRIMVMQGGKQIEIGPTERVFYHPEESYTKSLIQSALHVQTTERQETAGGALVREPILQVRDLRKYYDDNSSIFTRLFDRDKVKTVKAVNNVTLDLYPGEIFGLVGESGCGKSTLSKTILQLVSATSGTVTFNGTELTRLSPKDMRPKRREIQMIFQDPNASLNPKMTIGETITDALLIHELATRETAKPQVLTILEKVGLTPAEEYIDRYPNQLSGGQQQRVGIARALITRPKLIICDEPVSMLDATVQAQVLDLMLSLKTEFDLTYIFITHDLWLAKFLCDRVAVMNAGEIVEMGNTQDIFNSPQHPYTKELLAAAPLLARKNV